METKVDEIAAHISRLSTFVPDVGPTGFTCNQFVIDADEPAISHTGPRGMFPLVSEAVASVVPLDKLRWIMFGHLESDECGAMNLFLAAAPNSQVAHGALGCMVSINDLADRPPEQIQSDGTYDLGGRFLRNIDTPHVPHGWDAHVLYEETTGTLFCGDLFTRFGESEPMTNEDLVEAALDGEQFGAPTALTPSTAPTIRRLSELGVTTLALMHGPSYSGDC